MCTPCYNVSWRCQFFIVVLYSASYHLLWQLCIILDFTCILHSAQWLQTKITEEYGLQNKTKMHILVFTRVLKNQNIRWSLSQMYVMLNYCSSYGSPISNAIMYYENVRPFEPNNYQTCCCHVDINLVSVAMCALNATDNFGFSCSNAIKACELCVLRFRHYAAMLL